MVSVRVGASIPGKRTSRRPGQRPQLCLLMGLRVAWPLLPVATTGRACPVSSGSGQYSAGAASLAARLPRWGLALGLARDRCVLGQRERSSSAVASGICRAIRLLGPGVGVGVPAACSGRATTHGGLGTVSDSTTGACLIPSLSPPLLF
ncbi:hypothetical protein PVAP13_5NG038308 [Panicum virgatum]|uniref:Uncharacterized protein n=1 Tax=Panicum virgatum TaxID=38727 RepID=A0A8T0RLU5_PANVG|nr:hypothetical protein PVAP13_5NG038308 [Panicum virgatum]